MQNYHSNEIGLSRDTHGKKGRNKGANSYSLGETAAPNITSPLSEKHQHQISIDTHDAAENVNIETVKSPVIAIEKD